jgi:DNA polymerase III subunit delta'
MQFRQVIGQENVKAALRQMVDMDRLPHALMFLGPSGCGKLALAIALAQYLLCESREQNDACGHCRSCSKVSRLIHPDLHFSFPTVGTNVISDNLLSEWRAAITQNPYLDINHWLQFIGAENKQGNINKEECVNIVRKLSLKIFEGAYKVLIMWLPELLDKEGNRLLKIIEEPPENTVFILVAEDPEQILNTIISRCQIVKFKALRDEEVAGGLVNDRSLSAGQARSIAQLSNGDYHKALTLSENRESDNAAMFLDWMRRCYSGKGPEMIRWVDKFASLGRENQKHFIRYALHFMREYMMLKVTGNPKVRLQEEELKVAGDLVKVIQLDQVEMIVNLLTDCSYYVERNAHPKILFLDASINMNKILKRQHLEVVGGGV